jgi:hypothetical protein
MPDPCFSQSRFAVLNRGMPAIRAYPTIYAHHGPLGLNYWAASALFLEPGQTYELRLTLTDPDGGGETRTITATTRIEPRPDPTGRQLYVVPGDGGGDGSVGDPFQGMQAAADAAQPSDVLRVAAGTYQPLQLLTSGTPGHPIVFRGPGDGSAVVDGGNTDRGVVTLGEWNQTIGHVIVEGLTIQNGHWGVDAQHSHDIVIRHNAIRDVDFGVYNRRGDGLEDNQTVCDNVIEGRTPWPGNGIPSERGIDLRGYGNVVCHNTVRHCGDCISVQPFIGPSYGNDVYGNDASCCVDDGIEIDYNQANARVWRNRVANARMGVSVQPIRGGPAYIFRNEFFNLESVPIKMHNYTTGFYVAHNTGAKHGNGHGDNGAMWRNAVFRNNLGLISAFGVFVLRQAIMNVPNELIDAARVDGISEPGIFLRIILPLISGSLAALAVLVALGTWNDYLWPLIISQEVEMYTLQVGISYAATTDASEYLADWAVIMSTTSIASVPMLLLVIASQKYLVQGITLSGLKAQEEARWMHCAYTKRRWSGMPIAT